MKQLISPILLFLLASCSNGNNEMMTRLINDKKNMEDSIQTYSFLESKWLQQSKEEIHSTDTLKWKASADSSGYYFGKGLSVKRKLQAIEFSMDSLSKMK
jgi:hypothetical protein